MAMIAGSAAAANLENPLFIPTAGQVYSKTAAGLLYKKANDNEAMRAKDHAGAEEFPVWRLYQDLGIGITDRLTLRGSVGWTQDDPIGRKGLHNGRLGLNYRVFEQTTMPFVWDVYADAVLAGISRMDADLVASKDNLGGTYPLSFNYDNYSNGRWGVWVGSQVGKTWDDFTLTVFAEIQRTFGNDNNRITISDNARGIVNAMIAAKLGPSFGPLAPAVANAYVGEIPEHFSVNTDSTWEYATGVKAFYEIDRNWSLGGGFTIKHRANNIITDVNLTVDADAAMGTVNPAVAAAIAGGLLSSDQLTAGLADQFMGSLQDNIDEYIFTVAVARQLTDSIQVAVYGEYTFDNPGPRSQNGTDVKVEGGVRLNVAF